MRRLAAATAPPPTAAVKLHLWKSPIPYLFGGLSLALLLIAAALIILACSFRKRFTGGEKDPQAAASAAVDLVMEPKVLVIMAGDNMPTFLALPATAAAALPPCRCSANQQDGNQNHSP
ncbi:protein GLUTAMINE DUMPER 2-like [Benincasa hispida]|uniref:protein GLUTAMINE DUMPER 2-like n=1 Tax=Benincasa hispida TaxID=102211 RepID=UPI0019010CA8|nr:protein GLUTAMINE DUMPER 2-like [Benincasa hispida]